MLQILLTEDNTGVNVSGTYEDLFALREAVSDLIGDKKDYEGYEYVNNVIQKFAYELIHAYRAERESFMTNCDTPSYKFPMLLPEIIFVACALNDYIIMAEDGDFYIYNSKSVTPAIRQKIEEKYYIEKAYINFFQSAVWNAVKELIGSEKFDEIQPLRDFNAICANGTTRYRDYCSDWIDILNIRYINCESGRDDYIIEIIEKLAERDDEYISKEKAMKEHVKDGNISLYMNLLDELNYPDEWDW